VSDPLSLDSLELLQQAVQAWRDHPDGANFQEIARELQGVVEVTIAAARGGRKQAVLLAPMPGSTTPLRLQVSFFTDGSRVIKAHQHVRNFDDVVQDFLLRTLERFLENPSFNIRHPAYIRMGLVWCAYALERSASREAQRNKKFGEGMDTGPGPDSDREAGSFGGSWLKAALFQEDFLDVLCAIWFHPCPHHPLHLLPAEAPALSLRYLYGSIRFHSGTPLQAIAKELGVHGSRLSAVKRELQMLVGSKDAGEWLPLGDFMPFRCAQPVLEQIDLIGAHVRYSYCRSTRETAIFQRIQRHKLILWEAYLHARQWIRKSTPKFALHSTRRVSLEKDSKPLATLEFRIDARQLELVGITFSR
jgi:hypothetical protein